MDRPIRVAQVIGKACNGGVEACIMNYYAHIDRSKVQFDFLVESTSKIVDREKIEAMGGKVVIIPSYKNPFKYMKVLTLLFKSGEYDIVHSNMNTLSVFTLRAAKRAGIKIRIAHSHSTTNKKEFIRNLAKNILKLFSKKYATHFYACSKKAGEWLFGKKTFNSNRVVIINNGISINTFRFSNEKRLAIRNRYNIGNRFVMGHVGRFVEQKNHDFLIDVFYSFQKINPESILVLVGDGPLQEKVIKKVNNLGITEKVLFMGPQKDVASFYCAMDCFVMPSLYEGLPVVGVEAQINGLPCFFSSSITNEVVISDYSYIVDSSFKCREWVDLIVANCNNHCDDRELFADCFVGGQFDIMSESEKLTSNYLLALETIA